MIEQCLDYSPVLNYIFIFIIVIFGVMALHNKSFATRQAERLRTKNLENASLRHAITLLKGNDPEIEAALKKAHLKLHE